MRRPRLLRLIAMYAGPSSVGLDLHGAPLGVAGRRLDLEDVGSEVGQHHRAVRPGEQLAEVEDADPGERQ